MRLCSLPLLVLMGSSLAPARAQQPAQPASRLTVRAQARLVVVDVVVSNHGKAVHDLKASDFTLTENGTLQTLNSFVEHKALSAAESAGFPPLPPMPPGVFTNYVATPMNQAVNVILLDALNTPMQDQAYVRQQLLDYLKSSRPGQNTAIFGLSTQLVLLQGFTADPAILKRALARANSGASPLLENPIDGGGLPDTAQDLYDDSTTHTSETPSKSAIPGGIGNAADADTVARLQTFMDIQQSFELMLRAKYTLDGMNVLARYLASIPGRKNLIWFSGSFPLNILPDVTDNPSSAVRSVASAEDEYRETTNLLARSQVAVYPIDARGILTSPTLAASNPGTRYARNQKDILNDEQKFFARTVDEHSTMTRMAEDSGGRAFINTNGLTAAVDKAIEDGSSYYTLTYSPTNTVWKGDFRKIQVKLEASLGGYELEYRHHYYADNPGSATGANDASPSKAAVRSVNPSPELITKAMAHGLPGSTQMLFKVRILPIAGEPSAQLAPGNVAGDPKPLQPRRLYQSYSVDFAVAPADISYEITPDGTRHALVEFVSVVYQPDGTAITQTSRIVSTRLSAEQYQRIAQVGFPYHQTVSVPSKGSFSIRTAVHDLRTNRMGTTEVNVALVKNLEPLRLAAAPATPAAATTPAAQPPPPQ